MTYSAELISQSLLLIPLLSFFIQSVISATLPPNSLRLCSKTGESVDVDNSFCGRGWWLPKPIEPECICASGTWLLSENYCDPNFYLLSGPSPDDSSGQEFTCFKTSSPVRRIASLSRQSTKYSHYFINGNGKFITELDKPDYAPETETPVTIIRLNAKTEMYLLHREGVQASIWQKCVGEKQNRPYTHVIKHDGAITYLKSMGEEELCDEVRDPDFPYSRTNDSDFIISKVGSFGWHPTEGLLPLNPCTCTHPNGGGGSIPINEKRKEQTNTEGKALSPDDMDRNTDPDYDSVPGDSFNIYPKTKDPLLHAEHLHDNKRTTATILSKLKDFIMLGIKPPPFNNPLFEYIRLGKKILTTMCPEINQRIVGNLIGLFRLLLSDIIGRYPEEYNLNVDTGVHQRVLRALGQCLGGLGNRTVKFFWGKKEGEAQNCKEKEKILSVEIGGTSVPIIHSEEKGSIPPRLKFLDGDVMLEVAWKVLLGAHYACTEYFADNPEDLSFMYVKAQEFLTIPYVMFRWENPAKGLTAAYKILNPDLDAHVLGEQIDACVFAAFDSSSYNSWLGRPESEKEFIPKMVLKNAQGKLSGRSDSELGPFRPRSNKKNRLSGRILDGRGAFCLADFNDPISWNEVDPSFAEITGC